MNEGRSRHARLPEPRVWGLQLAQDKNDQVATVNNPTRPSTSRQLTKSVGSFNQQSRRSGLRVANKKVTMVDYRIEPQTLCMTQQTKQNI